MRHLAVFMLLAAAIASCSLGKDACLRMSDCDSPYRCVEGVCITDQKTDAVQGTSDSDGGPSANLTPSSPSVADASDQ